MASIFYSIQAGELKINDLVGSFRFEDSIEMGNLLVLVMDLGRDVSLVDHERLQKGQPLTFRFGYLGGKASQARTMKIANREVEYGQRGVMLTLKAMDCSLTLKKSGQSNRLWQQLTSSQIIEKITAEHGLKAQVSRTEKSWPAKAQGNRNDFEFIEHLATLEEGFIFFCRDDTVVFKARGLSQPSTRTFTYNDPNGGVISFRPSSQDTFAEMGSFNSEVITTDPLTNETKNSISGDVMDFLGQYPQGFNPTGLLSKADATKSGFKVPMPYGDGALAQGVANGLKMEAALNDLTAELAVEGDPALLSDIVVTMGGVAKGVLGNYYVTKVSHTISNMGYETRLSLQKNNARIPAGGSSSAAASKKAPENKVNKTTGPPTTEAKKDLKVFVYDADAREVKE